MGRAVEGAAAKAPPCEADQRIDPEARSRAVGAARQPTGRNEEFWLLAEAEIIKEADD